jgi:hypothetical protein
MHILEKYVAMVCTAQIEFVYEAMMWFATDMLDHLAHCFVDLTNP